MGKSGSIYEGYTQNLLIRAAVQQKASSGQQPTEGSTEIGEAGKRGGEGMGLRGLRDEDTELCALERRRVAWLEVLQGEVIRLKTSWAKAL